MLHWFVKFPKSDEIPKFPFYLEKTPLYHEYVIFYSLYFILGGYQRELHPDVRTVHSNLQANSNHVIRSVESSIKYIRFHYSFFVIKLS